METEIEKTDMVEIKVSLSGKAIFQIVMISTVANFAALTCLGIVRVIASKKVKAAQTSTDDI